MSQRADANGPPDDSYRNIRGCLPPFLAAVPHIAALMRATRYLLKLFRCWSKINLTRRANHLHIVIVARITARGQETGSGLFLCRKSFESDGGANRGSDILHASQHWPRRARSQTQKRNSIWQKLP